MRTALFLGAGASVFASQPATKSIMERVRERVRKREGESYKNKDLQNFVMGLVSDQIYSDVEKLYDGIELVINTSSRNCQPITNNMSDRTYGFSHEEIIDELIHLRSIIREILFESFVVRSGARMSIRIMYDNIWKVLKGNGTDELRIFTTNYDTVVEEYCDDTGLDVINGFKRYRRLSKVWANEWTTGAANSVHLTKLHGSINWHKNTDGQIMEIGGIEQRDARNDIMIAPTEGVKQYDAAPFSDLMEHFKAEIRKVDVLLVIGFSYRDEAIVNIIRDRVKDGMALISVSPDAVKDIQRLVFDANVKPMRVGGQRFKAVDTRIVLCEQEFGTDTINNIRATLEGAYRHIWLNTERARRKSKSTTL